MEERIDELNVLCKEILRLEKAVLDSQAYKNEKREKIRLLVIKTRVKLSELWGNLEPEVAQNWAERIRTLDEIYSDILQLDWLKLTHGRSGNERKAHRKKK